jgi:ABC-2 type transport system ATP-binding protein
LLADPPVLILDEPTAGLDPTQIRETRMLLRELGRQHTMLLSTHILSEVEMTCDSVIIIYQGKVVEDGALTAVRQRHKNENLEDIFVRLTGQEGI